ncbi:MAG TPA: CheR family methyltransferase, partial [Polyangiaceae bacterium]|nr:CheR family methyltransferase [Polyangiaceae bacterium]
EASVLGLELNPESLAKAMAALYTPWSLRETPAEIRDRWFTKEGRDFRLVRSLRESVRFAQHNLILDAPTLLPPASYDVIFCRNVLMYFTPAHAAAIVERLARALAPGGFLFLGHAETLRGLSHAFHLRHTHNTFYYQRRDGADLGTVASEPELIGTIGAPIEEVAAPESDWAGQWLTTVARSSERILQLNQGSSQRASAIEAPRRRDETADGGLSQPLELLRGDRFAEALEAMHLLSASEKADPAALLLRAALLTHQGELVEAESACHDLLRRDDLNAGAHYLLALCNERRGQIPTAIEHDRTAIYLDADFAMPHLHLGLMARRRQDPDLARRELGQALSLLEREEASRLLLFGGGFSRSALLSLCRSELSNLKGDS